MANPEHVELLKQGVVGWNAWRDKNPEVEPDLRDANLLAANLHGANLSRAVLHMANLNGTNLTEANLTEASLNGANLTEANLTDANLTGAILHEADLNGATLHNADLHNARMGGTIIAYTDFRRTKGIMEIKHGGPSPVVLYSIQLPQDGTALHFLRGVGVPDEYIDLWRSTMLRPIQYHSLFISYSSKDETLARRLHNDLQARGVRCWFAPEDLKIGSKIRQSIDEAIHLQDKLLLLLSAHALASDWVEAEVEAVLDREQRQGREVLLPIRLDEQVMQAPQAWARHLRRTRHIGDFSVWENVEIYQAAFERLLRDLKQEAAGS